MRTHTEMTHVIVIICPMLRYSNLTDTNAAEDVVEQEAQLPQRNSASAAHVYIGWLTDMQCTAHPRIAEVVLFFDIQKL